MKPADTAPVPPPWLVGDIGDERVYNNQETFRFPTDEEIFAKIDERLKK